LRLVGGVGHAELGVAECLEESVIINHQNRRTASA
jgi:hypothetical protein